MLEKRFNIPLSFGSYVKYKEPIKITEKDSDILIIDGVKYHKNLFLKNKESNVKVYLKKCFKKRLSHEIDPDGFGFGEGFVSSIEVKDFYYEVFKIKHI